MTNQIGSGTVKGMIEFLDNLISKGRVAPGSVTPMKTIVKQIMLTVDGKENWQEVDIRSVDVNDYIGRFANLTAGKYTAESLLVYKSRLNKAKNWYTNFLINPGWAPPKKTTLPTPRANGELTDAGEKKPTTQAVDMIDSKQEQKVAIPNDLITYPFPLRAGKIVHLYLPIDLTLQEAKRLGKYLESLSVDNVGEN